VIRALAGLQRVVGRSRVRGQIRAGFVQKGPLGRLATIKEV